MGRRITAPIRGDLKLKFAILEAGTTQSRVAAETGISPSRLSNIVRGYNIPVTADEQRRIAKALGKRVKDLFSDEAIAAAVDFERREAAAS